MTHTPCESIRWHGLPIIRKEIVKSMIKNFGLNQKQAAEKMGLTSAAVCQYLSRKRGKINIVNENILSEINISAEKIFRHGESIVAFEICRICKLMLKNDIVTVDFYKL
jgi:predicted transcriptional regulator